MYELHRVDMNYSKSLNEMIEPGNYGWINSDIAEEHFPVKHRENGKLEIHLVRFNKELSSWEARRLLDMLHLRPAELPELLALGAQHPELLKDHFIVGLGSTFRLCGIFLSCPVIRQRMVGGVLERTLSLSLAGQIVAQPWLETDWFAAVRK